MFVSFAVACTSSEQALSTNDPLQQERPPTLTADNCRPLIIWGGAGPVFSPLRGQKLVEAGCRPPVYRLAVPASAESFEGFNVIVGHSLGGIIALGAPSGDRMIFTIDPAPFSFLAACPDGASCVNYFNPADIINTGGTVAGADNINCFGTGQCGFLGNIPLIAHLAIPASDSVWNDIVRRIQAHVASADPDISHERQVSLRDER